MEVKKWGEKQSIFVCGNTAKCYQNELTELYSESTDYKVIDKIYEELHQKIMKYHQYLY